MSDFRPALFADITDAVRHTLRRQRITAVRAAAYTRIGAHGDADFAAWAVELGWSE
jgi:hypothetical protein